MPCDCLYMGPTHLEKKLQQTAKLIVYVESFFKGITPKWIIDESKNQYAGRKDLVPYLCNLIEGLDKRNLDRIVYNAREKTSRDLADWWDEHKRADRERIKREQAEARKKQLKKSALSKLSVEEKRALGIRD